MLLMNVNTPDDYERARRHARLPRIIRSSCQS